MAIPRRGFLQGNGSSRFAMGAHAHQGEATARQRNRWLPGLLVVAALLIVVLSWIASSWDVAPLVGAARAGTGRVADAAPVLVPGPTEPGRELVAAEQAPVAEPVPVHPGIAEVADLDVRDQLLVRVVDVHQVPIPGARLKIDGLRKANDGSAYGMRGEPGVAITDAEGNARIAYTRWVDIDAKAAEVDLAVDHPEFIAFRDSSFAIAAEPRTVVLQQGPMVRLTAWCRTPTLLVRNVTIRVDWNSRVPDSAWRRAPDGTFTTTRVPIGNHLVAVHHESAELGKVRSRIVAFEIAPGQQLTDVFVELRPLVTLRGRLAPEVPRPIVDGRIVLNLHARLEGAALAFEHEARIAADGTFVMPDLPEGSGQLIAWCQGWASREVVRSAAEVDREIPASISGEARQSLLEGRLSIDRGPPIIADSAMQDVVVAMDRTGVLEVHVTDLAGVPLPGVMVGASPNVTWCRHWSDVLPWSKWEAATDGLGIARIHGLPADPELAFGIESSTYQLRLEDRERRLCATMVSGETTRTAIQLERIVR